MATITKEQLEACLARPLSDVEQNNIDFYKSIALLKINDLTCSKVEELAEIPADLLMVIAEIFGSIEKQAAANTELGITSKKVEDFQVSYSGAVDYIADVIKRNADVIAKYSKCSAIRHGKTIRTINTDDDYGYNSF